MRPRTLQYSPRSSWTSLAELVVAPFVGKPMLAAGILNVATDLQAC